MAANIVPFPRRGANDNLTDPNPPQPGLRSFIVYDELPANCIAYEAPNDDTEPHIGDGEFAVIDTEDRALINGELYLIEWKSGIRDDRRQLVLLTARPGRYGKKNADGSWSHTEWEECSMWFLGGYKRRQFRTSGGECVGPPLRWVDGPYDDDGVLDRMIGRVVGIYQPNFLPMLRRAA